MGPPSRMPSGSNSIVTWRSALGSRARACVWVAISSFARDRRLGHPAPRTLTGARARGWIAGLGLALIFALIIGLLFGLLRVLAARGGAAPASGQLARVREWLFGGD